MLNLNSKNVDVVNIFKFGLRGTQRNYQYITHMRSLNKKVLLVQQVFLKLQYISKLHFAT